MAGLLLANLQGTPEAPQCGFSNMACRVLDAYGEPLAAKATSTAVAASTAAMAPGHCNGSAAGIAAELVDSVLWTGL